MKKKKGFLLLTTTTMITLILTVIAVSAAMLIIEEIRRQQIGMEVIQADGWAKAAAAEGMFRLTRIFNEQYTGSTPAPITTGRFLDISGPSMGVLEADKSYIEAVEDESAKLNLNTMSYALPHVLDHLSGAGLSLPVGTEDAVTSHGATLSLVKGTTRDGITYYYRPDFTIGYDVAPQDPPANLIQYGTPYENRHYTMHYYYTGDNWLKFDSIEQAAAIWQIGKNDLIEFSKYFTIWPTCGLNVNTCGSTQNDYYTNYSKILQGVMDWQMVASLGSPAGFQMINEFKGPDGQPLGGAHPEKALYPRFRVSGGGSSKTIQIFEDADQVIGHRYYTEQDLVQQLAVLPNVPSFQPSFDTWGNTGLENPFGAAYPKWCLVIQGPGPYISMSDLFTIVAKGKTGRTVVQYRITVRTSRSDRPRIMNVMRTIE